MQINNNHLILYLLPLKISQFCFVILCSNDVRPAFLQYDTIILTCAQKQTSSQLSLPHDSRKLKIK